MDPLREMLVSDKLRFLVAGASTTLFSYMLYVLLLSVFGPKLAYAVSYLLGIVWSYTASSIWVFRGSWSWQGLLSFPLVYLLQAALSFLLFVLVLDKLSIPLLLAPLVPVVLMLPVTYLIGRAVVRRTSAQNRKSTHD